MSTLKVVQANPQQTIVPQNQFVGPVFPQPKITVAPATPTQTVKVVPSKPQGQITSVGQVKNTPSIRPGNTLPAIDSMYKALSAGANPTAVLQEIYNQNKTSKPNVAESIKKAVQSGYNHSNILDEIFKQNGYKPFGERQDALAELNKPTPPDRSGGFFSRLGGDIKERVGNVQEAARNKDISNPSFGFQTAGQVAGGVLDIGNEALTSAFRTFAPKETQALVKAIGDKAGGNENVQALVGQYQQLKAEHPELVGNLEAAVNIASLVGAGKAITKVGQIASPSKVAGKSITDLVQPAMNKKLAINILKQSGQEVGGAQETGIFKSVSSRVTPKIQEIANDVGDLVSKGNSPIKNITNINREIASISKKDLQPALKSNKTLLNVQTTSERLRQIQPTRLIKSDVSLSNTYEQVKELMLEKIAENANDVKSIGSNELWEARKAFDRDVERQFGAAIFNPEKNSAVKQAIQDVREQINTILGEVNPQYRSQIKKLSNMYTARDTIAENNYKILFGESNRVSRFLGNHPAATRALKKTAGIVATGLIGGSAAREVLK